MGIGNPAAVYEDQCSIKTEAAQVDLRIAGVALSCSRDAGIGAEKVAKECVEVGRPRALDFLARENRIGLRLILAARDVGIARPAALAENQNFRDILKSGRESLRERVGQEGEISGV